MESVNLTPTSAADGPAGTASAAGVAAVAVVAMTACTSLCATYTSADSVSGAPMAIQDPPDLETETAPKPEPEPVLEPVLGCVQQDRCVRESAVAQANEQDAADELAAAITIMVNTSPIELHPSTIVIEEVVAALLGQVPLLRKCSLLIVCDWFKVKDQNKYRSGQITAEKASRYQEYVARLRRLSAQGSGNVLEGARVLVLSERCGFGFAVKEALPHVATPYILMQQHDRRLRQYFDVLGVVRAMIASKNSPLGPMHYVGLCTTTTLGHAHKMSSKHQIDIEPHFRTYPATDRWGSADSSKTECLRFMPLLQWYDSTHLCATEHYRSFVFGRRNGKRLVAKGGFIEDKLSQQQLAEVSFVSHDHKLYPRFTLLRRLLANCNSV